MRLIPKKTKLNTTIWKNFTLIDVGFMFAVMLLLLLILMSNISFRWWLFGGVLILSVVMFYSDGDIRAYREIGHMARFLMLPKTYTKGMKGRRAIDALMPQTEIGEDSIISYGSYYGGVLSVGSIEFRLLNEFSQNNKITQLSRIMNSLSSSQTMQIIKIDRPINLNQIDKINNIEKQYRPYYYIVIYDENKETLLDTLEYTRNELNAIGLNSDRLSQKDIAIFLKYCYTRNFDERAIDDIEPKDYLNFVKPNKVKFKTWAYEIDDTFAFNYTVSDYPLTVGNAWGAGLFNIDNTKVVLNIRPVDKEKSTKRIDRAVTEIGSRGEANKASQVISQDTHIGSMANLLVSLQNENEGLFDCTLTITGFNNAGVQNNAFRKTVRREIMSGGFKAHGLSFRQFDGFISGSVTRRNNLKSFERGINSESLAVVFPFVFTSIIEPDGMTLGSGSYPVIMDMWKRGANYNNSNAFVIGKSGSGKSYFTKTLLSLLHSDNCKIFMLDPENEYNTICKNFGGAFIDVGNATTGRLNPFHIYPILTDDGKTAEPEVVFWSHNRFLEHFFKVTLPGITADSLEELNNFVVKAYAQRNITPETDCEELKAEDYPTFDDLMTVVKKELEAETAPNRKSNLQRIETYIAKFASGGRNSNLWNGAATLKSDEKFVVFNFQSLLESKNTTVSNGQMLLVMRYLEKEIIKIREVNRNSTDGTITRTLVGIDEGYALIDPNYPIALEFVFQWYKRIRKYGGGMMFLTQNLGDILGNSDIVTKTSAIINNSQYSFVFSLAPRDIEILTDLYKNAGEINETEANEIATAATGQCFMISSPRERTSFKVIASSMVEKLFNENVSKAELLRLVGSRMGADGSGGGGGVVDYENTRESRSDGIEGEDGGLELIDEASDDYDFDNPF